MAATLIQQSTTTEPLLFLLVSSGDHIAAVTGASPTVKISKNAAAGASPAGAVSEIDSTNVPGWYQVAANSTDANTLGQIILHASHASADPCDMLVAQVVSFNPRNANLGLTNVSANVAQVAGATVDTTLPQLGVRVVNIAAAAVSSTSAQIGANLISIAGAAVDTTAAQLGVRLVNVGASAVNSASAQLGVNVVAIAVGAVTSTAFTTDAIGSTQLASTAVIKISDGMLDRDMSLGADNGSTTVRTVRQALRFLRNKWSIAAGTLTICKEDDTATSWTAAVTTDSTALPIVTNDPAG